MLLKKKIVLPGTDRSQKNLIVQVLVATKTDDGDYNYDKAFDELEKPDGVTFRSPEPSSNSEDESEDEGGNEIIVASTQHVHQHEVSPVVILNSQTLTEDVIVEAADGIDGASHNTASSKGAAVTKKTSSAAAAAAADEVFLVTAAPFDEAVLWLAPSMPSAASTVTSSVRVCEFRMTTGETSC